MKHILSLAGNINGIYHEHIRLAEPFLDMAERFADLPGTVLLASGGQADCARYHILAIKPWLTFSGRSDVCQIILNDRTHFINKNPFEILRDILHCYKSTGFSSIYKELNIPVQSGLFGYFSYDLKDCIEDLPHTSIDDLMLPHICLYGPSMIIVHDIKQDMTSLCILDRNTPDGNRSVEKSLAFFHQALTQKPNSHKIYRGDGSGFLSNFTKQRYLEALEQIKEYIASGHIYQANLSQRFKMDFSGNTFLLFKTLFEKNPAPFFAYINAGDHHIVSTSPERFLFQKGNTVETRPIKGTRPRGKTPAEDKTLAQDLQQSKKDDAELSMIVDLLRNDLGKVCEAGTVQVEKHKMLESYKNVFHLVSIVKGTLADTCDSADLLKACFPGGSITGCPKIRAMEIIDELEPTRRHIYTGAIGYISFHDTMDLSIAIRTATVYNQHIIFSVGGGIVFDSDPEDEFNETLHKGQTLMKAFQNITHSDDTKTYTWINGSIHPSEHATIPVSDLGFLYGYGFFETIRVDNGHAKYLDDHIHRFNTTWLSLFPDGIPDISWGDVISQVISKNKLNETVAAIKMIATRGNHEHAPYNHSLIVMAKPYEHRLLQKNKRGLDLVVYPQPRHTPLADHKTLNYLYYFLAGKWALHKGFDEAIILNSDETLSETNTANILCVKNKTVIKPISYHVLPGVMERIVIKHLRERGYSIDTRKLSLQDCLDSYQLIITNSLMGAVPVLSINGIQLDPPILLCTELNTKIL